MSELESHISPPRSVRKHIHVMSLSLLGADGRVIISTLPSGPAPGADLFRRLLPSEKENILSSSEPTQNKRLFLPAPNGAFLLYTGMCASHGVILAAKSRKIPSANLYGAAAGCGFEKTRLRCPPRLSAEAVCGEDSTVAANFAARMIELEQLFEDADRLDLTSDKASVFLDSLARLSGRTVRLSLEGVGDPSLLREIDGKALGIAFLTAISLTDEGGMLSVTLRESSARLWAVFEIPCSPRFGRSKTELDELERVCGGLEAFERKKFSIAHSDTSITLTFSPTVFDPTAEGLMQNHGLCQKTERRGFRG